MRKAIRWVIGIGVVVAIAALLLWELRERDLDGPLPGSAERNRPLQMDTAMFRVLPLETVEYLADCGRETQIPADPTEQDDFIRRCLHRLSGALDAQARRDTSRAQVIRLHVEAMHQEVAAVAQMPASVVHQPAPVREAMMAQSYLLVQLQRARYRAIAPLSREVARARRSARGIDDREPLGEQIELLEDFFRRAGNALYLMEARDSTPKE